MKNLLKLTLVISLFLLSGVGNFLHAAPTQIQFPLFDGNIQINQTWTAENIGIGFDKDGITAVATITESLSSYGFGYGYLWTSVMGIGNFTFSFDFKTDSYPVSGGEFPDLFIATIYFDTFLNTAPVPIAIIDVDASGPTFVAGDLKTLPDGWTQVSLNFTNSGGNIIPAFELLGLDTTDGNSSTSIRNVSLIAQVPEPSSLMLLGVSILGVGLLLIQRRRAENFKTFI
jgi:hypothetical protein